LNDSSATGAARNLFFRSLEAMRKRYKFAAIASDRNRGIESAWTAGRREALRNPEAENRDLGYRVSRIRAHSDAGRPLASCRFTIDKLPADSTLIQ
jgi:hypothetical protein